MSNIVVKYVWELPVRICHWVNVLAMTTLVVTGLLIGHPKTFALQPADFVMGWIRLLHFVAGYTFIVCLAARVYWSFIGNRYASWQAFCPWLTPEGRAKMLETFRFYVFVDRKVPHTVGHNPMAATAYTGVFALYLLMAFTGLVLYNEFRPGSIGFALFGWVGRFVSSPTLRLLHHGGMWLLVGFIIQHVYSSVLLDIKERGGLISAMVSGFKAVEDKE